MSAARSLYGTTTPDKCAAEIADLPAGLRNFLDAGFSVTAATRGQAGFPAYLIRMEFGDRGADLAIDVALLRLQWDNAGAPGVVGFILAELAAFWEALEEERARG